MVLKTKYFTVYIWFRIGDTPVQKIRKTGIQALNERHASNIAKAVAANDDHIKGWDIVGVSSTLDTGQ